ncbi:MAG: MFS transporter, partial [Spirochaetes bacterium]|nr:MFS transporter [Spirochaetota bacterium]
MQGRVFTLLGSVGGAMMPLGLAVAGPVADAIGVRPWYIVAGVVTVAMAVAALFVPPLMGIEEQASKRAKGK